MHAIYEVLTKAFLVLPQFALGDALVKLAFNQFLTGVFENFGIDNYRNPFSFGLIGWHLVALGIEGAVLFIINLLIDSRGCVPAR